MKEKRLASRNGVQGVLANVCADSCGWHTRREAEIKKVRHAGARTNPSKYVSMIDSICSIHVTCIYN